MKVLISGFEPFGANAVNPTERLMKDVISLPRDYEVSGLKDLQAVVLPVTFKEAFEKLASEIADFGPDTVVAFGLAAGRSDAIEIERIAMNCIDCEIPDNDGRILRDEKILPNGENALFSTLPMREMIADLEKAGVRARISNTAGAYVCNFLFYRLQSLMKETGRRSGFVHVPFLSDQIEVVSKPSISFDDLRLALRTILSTLAR